MSRNPTGCSGVHVGLVESFTNADVLSFSLDGPSIGSEKVNHMKMLSKSDVSLVVTLDSRGCATPT